MMRVRPSRFGRSPLCLGLLLLGPAPALCWAQEKPADASLPMAIDSAEETDALLRSARELRERLDGLRTEVVERRKSGSDPAMLRQDSESIRDQLRELKRVEELLVTQQRRLSALTTSPSVSGNRKEVDRLKQEAESLRREIGVLDGYQDSLPQLADTLNTRAAELQLLHDARAIVDPGQRTLAFDRTIRVLISSNNSDSDFHAEEALEAIRLGLESSGQIPVSTVRDVRIDNLAETAIALGQALQLAALAPRLRDPLSSGDESRGNRQRIYLDQARQAFELAAELATRIEMPDFECNRLSQVAEYTARLSSAAAFASLDSREKAVPDAASDGSEPPFSLRREADKFLVMAHNIAQRIPYPQWRNQSLVTLASIAAQSNQFVRGREIALSIALPRYRVESLVELAEAQIAAGKPDDATVSYQDALNGLLGVQQPSVRETFGLILFDSLLQERRFDDARAVTSIVRTPELRINALSLLATAMGENGLSDSANRWIDQTVPEPALRDRLRRRVIDGYARYVQDRRSKETQGLPTIRPSGGRFNIDDRPLLRGNTRTDSGGPGRDSDTVPNTDLRRNADDLIRENRR